MNIRLIIAGVLVLAFTIMGGILRYYKSELDQVKKDLAALKINYGVCTANIETQNAAIKKVGEEKIALDEQLSVISKKNREVTQKNKKLQEELSKRPIPTTCPDQLSEIRQIGVDLAKEWNK